MDEISDRRLLDRFVSNESEDDFRELVRRHVALVHSVALRHTDNAHHAQDITQVVFMILARKARSLGPKVVLSGWLYHTARLTAANLRRSEMHRAHREREASMEYLTESETENVWSELVPVLDAGMARLRASERDAVVLRYFENKSLREVAMALGVEERAAQRRVSRSIEKLRSFFRKRGIVLTAGAIVAAVSAKSVEAAPMHLGVSLTANSLRQTASATLQQLVQATLRRMLWPKLQSAGAGVLALSITASLVATHHPTRAPAPSNAPALSNVSLHTNHIATQAPVIPEAAKSPAMGASAVPNAPASSNVSAHTNYTVNRAPVIPKASNGPVTTSVKTAGTADPPVELVHQPDGQQQTDTDVLPNEAAFMPDRFSGASRRRGEVVIVLNRSNLQMSNAPVIPLTNHATVSRLTNEAAVPTQRRVGLPSGIRSGKPTK